MFAENVIIIGGGRLANSIAIEINSKKDSGYNILALFHNSTKTLSNSLKELPSYKGFDRICEMAKTQSANQVIVALDEKRGEFPTEELLYCKMAGIHVVDGLSFYEALTGKILVDGLSPSWLIFSEGFEKSTAIRIIKRCSDVVLSLIALILTLPFVFLIALLIKLDSRGPVFYSQIRCGAGGLHFRLYKFRSMIADAEGQSGAVWAEEDDPRITRVGRVIRKLRIDEMPQLWNVLKGNMSFVGPRPERPEFIDKLEEVIPFYKQRMGVKPGITGWAQICHHYGSTIEDAKEKLEYELFYIKNMNLLLDLTIMFQTIKIVLLGKGAR